MADPPTLAIGIHLSSIIVQVRDIVPCMSATGIVILDTIPVARVVLFHINPII